jgi:hypothetical protein
LSLVGVDDTDKINIRHMVVFLSVEFAQVSHTDDPDTQLSH